ncbi:MAG: hypothetical protein V3U73_07240 [bacterium]
MLDEKQVELIHHEMDGMNSEEESVRLEELLARNAEARALFADLSSLSEMLAHIEERDPSPNIKKHILNAIQPQPHSPVREDSFVRSIFKKLRPLPGLRYGYTFAAGLAAGLVLYALLGNNIQHGRPADISSLYGSMFLDELDESSEAVASFQFDLDEIEGNVVVRNSEGLVLVVLSLSSSNKVEALLEFNEDQLSFWGLSKPDDDTNVSMESDKDYIRLTSVGDNEYFILFEQQSTSLSAMNLKIVHSGNLLYEKSFFAAKKSEAN